MKKWLDISLISLLALLLWVMPVLPHHHHGDRACVAVERCADDGQYNDQHTSHHADAEHGNRTHSNCVWHLQLAQDKVHVGVEGSVSHWCPLWGVLQALLSDYWGQTESLLLDNYHCGYISPFRNSIYLLRAPPVVFFCN